MILNVYIVYKQAKLKKEAYMMRNGNIMFPRITNMVTISTPCHDLPQFYPILPQILLTSAIKFCSNSNSNAKDNVATMKMELASTYCACVDQRISLIIYITIPKPQKIKKTHTQTNTYPHTEEREVSLGYNILILYYKWYLLY